MLNKKWIIYLVLALCAAPAFSKYTVCSVTINSSDEIEVFKKFLSPDHFEFIELLPEDKSNYKTHDSHWFNQSCSKDIKCDLLVVSGHFGGTFFGKSGFTLPTDLMEEKSCQKSCPNILSHAKEIFLFGCNTLADKQKDRRTYQEYLNVLLEDGMARETAERVVASRYSPLEAPFFKRMNFIFSGSQTVYGFDQLSPLGEHIRGSLEYYFQDINKNYGSYHEYLNKKVYGRAKNTELLNRLSHTTISQAHLPSLPKSEKDEQLFKNKCTLFDVQSPFVQRAQSLENIFKTQNSGSAFFAIEHFLNRHEKQMVEGEGREVYREIRTNSIYREQFKSFYKHLSYLPYVKIIYLNILRRFQWIDSSDFQSRLKRDVLNLIKNPNSESYFAIQLLVSDDQINKRSFFFSPEEIPSDYIKNIWSLLILEKLQARVPHLQEKILNYCYQNIKKTPALCHQSLNTLAHIEPSERIATEALNLLNSKDQGVVFYTLRMLGQSSLMNRDAHIKIASFLNDENSRIRDEAIDALTFINTPYGEVQNKMSEILRESEDEKTVSNILSGFAQVDILSDTAMNNIIYFIRDNLDDKSLVYKSLQSFKGTKKISNFALDYFYKVLENREDLDSFYLLLSVIPEMKTQDLGIYYRVSQIYKEPKRKLKIKALQNLSALTWFHPELQVEFSNILLDKNKEVRELGLRLLQNIKNLSPRAQKHILSLDG